ncbi:uncharacterized protein LOC131148449 [Malania oleifera]|uniref:uncharacterized protein LOC131148449 n=1 Tax=Malania oleifera TaxID=397392 RepID=UPI0025AEA762|nr:uncharacterized protein LOC131148449 [Malania oleifera]
MADDPDFTVELDLTNFPSYGWPDYNSFIEDIRRQLPVRYSHNRPVLTPESQPPSHWFHVVLRTSENYAVRFAMRADNLYLVGYRFENSQQWFEFTETVTREDGSREIVQLIDESTLLGFSGGYNALLRAAETEWTSIGVNFTDVQQAVANLNTDNGQQRAKSLLKIIIMISEAIRFEELRQFISTNYNTASATVTPEHQTLVRSWGNLSGRLLRADIDPDLYYFRLPANNTLPIQTAEEAAAALGIIKDCVAVRQSSTFQRVSRAANLYGEPLVEVFSVSIKTSGGEIGLYGMVTVTDGLNSQYMYDRLREDPESIYSGDTITLTGPARSISAYDSFTIAVDLMDENADASTDEVSYGQLSWNVFVTANEYDTPLKKDVEGKGGSVTISYIVLSNAVQANVEIILINGDGKDPAQIFGIVTAASDQFSNYESMLKILIK